jgi:hypothetical protein
MNIYCEAHEASKTIFGVYNCKGMEHHCVEGPSSMYEEYEDNHSHQLRLVKLEGL